MYGFQEKCKNMVMRFQSPLVYLCMLLETIHGQAAMFAAEHDIITTYKQLGNMHNLVVIV